jgi:hypothetical protein
MNVPGETDTAFTTVGLYATVIDTVDSCDTPVTVSGIVTGTPLTESGCVGPVMTICAGGDAGTGAGALVTGSSGTIPGRDGASPRPAPVGAGVGVGVGVAAGLLVGVGVGVEIGAPG